MENVPPAAKTFLERKVLDSKELEYKYFQGCYSAAMQDPGPPMGPLPHWFCKVGLILILH